LDEARWELSFLLEMQVPEGQPLAGMAHHKIHNRKWTKLGLGPHEDTEPRFLRPPSTAATLNLAAAAAQGARLLREKDPACATRALAAAERAWTAALAHPGIFASPKDSEGGGPYDDGDVSDEFYWAACELFVTTGAPRYRQYLASSPHYGQV